MWSTGKGTAPPWLYAEWEKSTSSMWKLVMSLTKKEETCCRLGWRCCSKHPAPKDPRKNQGCNPALPKLDSPIPTGCIGNSASGMLAPELCGDLDEDLINPASPARWSHRENNRCVCCCRLFRRRRTIRQEAPPFRAPPSRKDVILPETMF